MKRLLTILSSLLIPCLVWAGPLQFTDASVQTNGAAQVTQTPDDSGFVSGYIEGVFVDFNSGASETNTITLTTLGTGSAFGAARTLLTLSDVTADGYYPVRDLATDLVGADITATPARLPLWQDKLRLTAISSGADSNTTAVVMDVYVIVTDKP